VAGAGEAALAPDVDSPQALFTKLSPGPGKPAAEVQVHQQARVEGAMLELVAEQGYAAITVRDLVGLAKVSSKAFYSLFAGKEECFLRTHEQLVRHLVRGIVTAQAAEPDWRDRLRATFAAFLGELERDPRVARLLLIDAYAAGPVPLDQVQRTERTFEARIRDCFDQAPGDFEISPLLMKGIASGVICITRSRLLGGREDELLELVDDLTGWALSFYGEAAFGMLELSYLPAPGEPAVEIRSTPSSEHEGGTRAPVGDRALILDAVTKLVMNEGYESLTVPTVCLAAGVSRRRFHLQYGGVEECFVEAANHLLAETFARVAATTEENEAWGPAIQSMMLVLCQAIASDGALQKLGFVELFKPGVPGVAACNQSVERLYDLIVGETLGAELSRDPSAEASAGAIWGILHCMAVDQGHCRPTQVDATLSLLAMAPLVAVESPVP
jgi:AcrR family transcriptional regulator